MSFGAGFILLLMDEFFLKGGEEGLHRGEDATALQPSSSPRLGGLDSFPAVPFAAHRARDAVLGEQTLVVFAGLLHPAVRMDHEVCSGTLATERYL